MEDGKNQALNRLRDRWPSADQSMPEYAEACRNYSPAVVDEAVDALLLRYGGMGAPYASRLRETLADIYRSKNPTARSSKPNSRRDGGFFSSSVFDGAEWENGRGPKMRALANGPMPELWRRQIAEERARALSREDELMDMHEAMRRGLLSGRAAGFLVERAGVDLSDLPTND